MAGTTAGPTAGSRAGTSTCRTPACGPTSIVMAHPRLPGALASTRWGPGSTGSGLPQAAGPRGTPSTATRTSGSAASDAGTRVINRDSRGSRFRVCCSATATRSARPSLSASVSASPSSAQAEAVFPWASWQRASVSSVPPRLGLPEQRLGRGDLLRRSILRLRLRRRRQHDDPDEHGRKRALVGLPRVRFQPRQCSTFCAPSRSLPRFRATRAHGRRAGKVAVIP